VLIWVSATFWFSVGRALWRRALEAVLFYTAAVVPDFLIHSMTSKHFIVGTCAPARALARGLLALACVVAVIAGPLAHADVALYQAAVSMKGTTEADRTAAFGDALRVAAVRASGRSAAATAPRIVAAAADPMGFVQQYSTSADRTLKVGFDARAMEQLLQQAGLPLWPAERPVTTVYLFASGAARALTAAEASPDRLLLEQAAQVRGLPLAWPADAADLGAARARLAAGASSTLIGVAAAAGYQWSFAQGGQAANAQGDASAGANLAADSLAARYAPASTRTLNTVTVRIEGVSGVTAYAALTRYLDDLSLVRSTAVTELAGNTVQLQLAVRGDLELLRRIFALDGHLAPTAAAGAASTGTSPAPDFTWQP
jgi:hypothetical protein